jgi:hypothetical protein
MPNQLINLVKLTIPNTICVIAAITSPGKTFYNNYSYQV